MHATAHSCITHSIRNLCWAVTWPVSRPASIDPTGKMEISLCNYTLGELEKDRILKCIYF